MYVVFKALYQSMQLLKNQWLSPPEIEAIQRRKLKHLVKHAYENVHYYRELFDSAGIKAETISDLDALSRIPITTKKKLQSLPLQEITAKGVRIEHCTKLKTSGSTGIPLDIFLSQDDLRFRGAVFRRAFRAHGIRLRDRVAHVTNHSKVERRHWYESLGIRRKVAVSARETVDDQIGQLKKVNPDVLIGSPSALRYIAEKVGEQGEKGITPRITVSGGEVLAPHTRGLLNTLFKTTTIDFYSTFEFGNIAWECKDPGGYHINADALIVEVIRDGKAALPGERGEIVITGLHGRAMPLIRYSLGDIGVLSGRQCSCGRGLPLLERIEGRTEDDLKLPNGKRVPSNVVRTTLKTIPGISQFRVVQESINGFRVYLTRQASFSQATIEQVERELRNLLGDSILLQIQVMDTIPLDPSGKQRSIICQVEEGFEPGSLSGSVGGNPA